MCCPCSKRPLWRATVESLVGSFLAICGKLNLSLFWPFPDWPAVACGIPSSDVKRFPDLPFVILLYSGRAGVVAPPPPDEQLGHTLAWQPRAFSIRNAFPCRIPCKPIQSRSILESRTRCSGEMRAPGELRFLFYRPEWVSGGSGETNAIKRLS